MKFHYVVQNEKGEHIEGDQIAEDRIALAHDLKGRGLTPLVIDEEKKKFGQINIPFVDKLLNKIKLREKIIFTHNLAGMLHAGLSLYRALNVLEKQTKNKKFRDVLIDLTKTIDSGGTLSEGMAKFPKVFSTLFVSMVKAGEESGSMTEALNEIGSNLEKSYELNKKIKSALMYPSIIFIAIIIIAIFMLMFVVPTLTKTFKELNSDLPASTKFVIWISDTVANHPILFIGGLGLIFGSFYAFARMKSMARYFDYMVLKLPMIGEMAKELNSARTTRTLSSLLTARVDMTRALDITKDVVQNVYYKKIIEDATNAVQKGVPLSQIFKNNTNYYPVMVGEMMEVGEETGKLSDMLIEIANFYEGEVDAKTKNLSTIIEPILMVFIGGAVGFFAVSMITPMYSVMNNI